MAGAMAIPERSSDARALASTPYWWEDAPRPSLADRSLPPSVDVAVIGSGITGLSAARTLARAGRSVLILEAGAPGHGASSRNAGYVGRTLKHSFRGLAERRGLARAIGIYRELRAAFDAVVEVVRTERIDCALRICGRFIAANSPRQYEELARELEARRTHLGDEFEMVPRSQQHREIGSELYFGGALIPDLGALHPGLYHLGLLDAAMRSGAHIAANNAVAGVRGEGRRGRFEIESVRGTIRAKDVVVATNGYAGPAVTWVERRVIPFDAYMIATEPLPPALLDRALPQNRTFIDSNHNINFIRRSPDGRRILFGGRTGSRLPSPEAAARRLGRELARIFPDLAGVPLTHSWTGRCAATFDLLPHMGAHDGIHFAMGYCFAGVPMGTYLGQKVALKILGSADAETVFDGPSFPTFPFYRGRPWFVPPVMGGLDLVDRWHGRARKGEARA